MGQRWDISNDEYWKNFCEIRTQMLLRGDKPMVEFVTAEGSRTMKQNAALHKWLEQVADALNNAGLDMKTVLKPEVDIDWTKESAKEYLWKPLEKVMFGHDSTTQANRVQYGDVEETVRRHLSAKFGVSLPPWPVKDREAA
ncbi:MAG: hypothetical protein ACPGSM_09640 [Thiolinea sp.]